VARLTAHRPSARAAVGLPADDGWIGLGLVTALVVLAILRVALGGWAPVAPDDARYLYVGLSILDGHGPLTPSGSTFLLRSPVYGLALAAGSSLVGGDPLIGARLVALGLSLLALAGALRLGWLLAGAGGALGTAFALVAAALIWRLMPSLRIDLPQTAAIVAALLAIWRPTTRRWVLGGVLLGLAILVKETALPLLILPVAFIGSVPRPRLLRLSAVFVGATVLTAAWWWLVVWLSTGQVFPLNALSVIEARDVDVALRVDRSTALLLALAAAGWGLVAWRALRHTGARLLLVAAIGLAPASLYAASLGLNARNFAGLAILSAVAVGAGGAWLVAALRQRQAASSLGQRRLATIALIGVAVVALVAPVVGQRDAGRVAPDRIGDELAAWLVANVPDGGRIAMTFREREQMALRLYGRADVATLPIARVAASETPADYLWMGLRDRQLFGYRQSAWVGTLSGELGGARQPADLLVLVGPHPFTPTALTTTSGADADADLGLTPATTIEADGDRAEIYRVAPGAAVHAAAAVPLHLSADAAEAWLDLAGGDDAGRLLDAGPIVDGAPQALATLVDRLGAAACATPTPEGSIALGRAGTCPD
jgi:hypothetical protein